jgi:hypothetical protein
MTRFSFKVPRIRREGIAGRLEKDYAVWFAEFEKMKKASEDFAKEISKILRAINER